MMFKQLTQDESDEIYNLLKDAKIFIISNEFNIGEWKEVNNKYRYATFDLLSYDWKWNWFRLFVPIYRINLKGSFIEYDYNPKSSVARLEYDLYGLSTWRAISFEELLEKCPKEYHDLFLFNINLFT